MPGLRDSIVLKQFGGQMLEVSVVVLLQQGMSEQGLAKSQAQL
jgi:hypothetical protein